VTTECSVSTSAERHDSVNSMYVRDNSLAWSTHAIQTGGRVFDSGQGRSPSSQCVYIRTRVYTSTGGKAIVYNSYVHAFHGITSLKGGHIKFIGH